MAPWELPKCLEFAIIEHGRRAGKFLTVTSAVDHLITVFQSTLYALCRFIFSYCYRFVCYTVNVCVFVK